ncbi:hypothetical protein HHI36_001556 [Cryptolaemus montrouzieri]|uniref:Uncharacterized protein n=1 Tax=Cryptolaemus montrouzieri TaxID=559131 RepID=A0ABD2P8P3_9CUCU
MAFAIINNIHKYTWIHTTRNLESIIDYIVGRRRSLQRVDDVRVYRGAECGSDHHFIKAKIYFAKYTHMIPPTQEITDEERQCKPKRYKLDLLQDPTVAFLYKLRLSHKLTQIDDSTLTKLYDGLVKSIHQVAEEILGELDNERNKRVYTGGTIRSRKV